MYASKILSRPPPSCRKFCEESSAWNFRWRAFCLEGSASKVTLRNFYLRGSASTAPPRKLFSFLSERVLFASPAARQNGLLDHLLHALEPELFPETCAENAWYKDCKAELLCFALRVSCGSTVPNVEYEGLDTWTSLAAALKEHYLEKGKPLTTTPQQSPEDLAQGYFRLAKGENEENHLTCVLDTRADKAVVTFDKGGAVFGQHFRLEHGRLGEEQRSDLEVHEPERRVR